jgi:Flp pilus assembly protein TadG
MRRSDRRPIRRGAAMLEAAIVLPVFLILVLGTIDTGLAVFRHNTLSQAARTGVRHAMVHGENATAGWNGGPWGPTTIDQDMTATGVPVVAAVQPTLFDMPADQTRIRVEWPDGHNRIRDSVRVTVTSTYTPMITWIWGGGAISLHATSTMPIAN